MDVAVVVFRSFWVFRVCFSFVYFFNVVYILGFSRYFSAHFGWMEACCSSRITSNSQSHGACVCLLYSKLLCTCFGCNRQGVLGRLILRLKIISFFLLFFLKGVCIFLKKTNKKDCVGHLLYVHCFLFNTDVCSPNISPLWVWPCPFVTYWLKALYVVASLDFTFHPLHPSL